MKRLGKFLTHCIAECDCGWREEDYKTASRKAGQHAKKTGHSVRIEYGYVQHISDEGVKNV